MADRIIEKLKKWIPFSSPATLDKLPRPIPVTSSQRLVKVFVEGYDDVAFWRGIFDHFTNSYLRFEISVPTRPDLPKGKKVLMGMIPRSSEELLLCVDSDFDYLFEDHTPQSREVNTAPFMFHTYAYATENYLCYAPSLHNVCVRATKNDTRIFDFEKFMCEYSRAIYPLFLWYSHSAQLASEHQFTLLDFKASVRIGYLEVTNNGADTLAWLRRNVAKREQSLRLMYPQLIAPMKEFETRIQARGLTPENAYLFMQGHTLMDNVVLVVLNTVCEKLRQMSIATIIASNKRGTALKNELSNYTNSLRSIRDVLLDNENYTSNPFYQRLHQDIATYMERTIRAMIASGQSLPPEKMK
ncbi:MAG: DUF4435 domain-containing protein [Alistipes sp.]